MNSQQIFQLVKEGADAHLGETIERLFSILRNRHTHQCWRKECDCEYYLFINGPYVREKLKLHSIKKHLNRLDNYWCNPCSDGEIGLLSRIQHEFYTKNLRYIL